MTEGGGSAYKRRIGSHGVAVAVVAGVFAVGASRPAPCAPRAVVPVSTRDVGRVVVGARVAADFDVRNEGDAPLALRGTEPASAAAVVRFDRVIAPGRTGRVRVAVDTMMLAGPSAVPVRLRTDDPVRPLLELVVALDAQAFVVARPGRARFVFVRGADPVTVRQTLRAADGARFRVLRVRSPVPALAVTRPGGPSRTEWTIDLTLGPDAGVGPLAAVVEVDVDHPRQKRLAIPVSGFVRPVLAVTPPALVVADASERPWRARLHVRSFADEPVEVLRVTTDVRGVALAVVPIDPGRTYAVDVESAGSAATGTIRIETSSAAEPVVEVAVRRRPGGG